MKIKKKIVTSDFDGASIDSFSKPVDSLAHIGAGIFRVGVQDIKRNISKVVSSPEPMTSLDRLAIDKPLNPEVGIIDGLKSAFQMNTGLFWNSFGIVQSRREDWFGKLNVSLNGSSALPHLQSSQLVQPVPVKGVEEKSGLGADVQAAAGRGFAQHVYSVAGVGAAVLGVSIQNVQGDESKVISSPEAMALRNRLAIAEPLNLSKG